MPRIIQSALILLLVLTATVLTDSIVKTDSKKIVVQSDHYASKEEKKSTYLLEDVKVGEPLVLVLRKEYDHSLNMRTNHVVFTLES